MLLRVGVDELLQLSLLFVALRSRDNLATFENDDRRNGHDVVLRSELHVVGYVYFANFGSTFVCGR